MDIIVAVTSDWAIGKDGSLLYSIPDDMRFFREKTKGAAVVMGRATLESFPGGRPLKGRRNIVLTKNASYKKDGVEIVHSMEEAIELIRGERERPVFIIGGDSIYRQFLPYCSLAYITKMDITLPADSFFPNLDSEPGWVLEEDGPVLEHENIKYRFTTYKNIDVRSVNK